jgi:hypothetical protein
MVVKFFERSLFGGICACNDLRKPDKYYTSQLRDYIVGESNLTTINGV